MSPLRVLSRLVGLMWALVLAAAALGIALYCFDALVSLGQARPDRLLHLVTVRKEAGRFLDQLQAPGKVAILSLLCGVGAVMVGLVLLRGLVAKPRERLAVLDGDSSAGVLAVRKRTLTEMLRSLVTDANGVREVKRVGLSLRSRRSGGRVKVETVRADASDESAVKRSIEQSLQPIAEPFGLKSRVGARTHGTSRRSRAGTS